VTTSSMPAEENLFSAVGMRVIAIANDGVQKRAQDSHSAFNEEQRFDPEGGAVAKNTDEDGNCDCKDHEQPDFVGGKASCEQGREL
jgi:hypothetical protein